MCRFFMQDFSRRIPCTRIALGGETPDMWEELGDELGVAPDNHVGDSVVVACCEARAPAPNEPAHVSLPTRTRMPRIVAVGRHEWVHTRQDERAQKRVKF